MREKSRHLEKDQHQRESLDGRDHPDQSRIVNAHVRQKRLENFSNRRREKSREDNAAKRKRRANRALPVAESGTPRQKDPSQNPNGHATNKNHFSKKARAKLVGGRTSRVEEREWHSSRLSTLDSRPIVATLALVKISIVVPAFNEERLLGESLAQIKSAASAFARIGWEFELIVCDNNSTDRTAEIAHAAGATVVFEPI